MDLTRARELLEALLQGRDPDTGEPAARAQLVERPELIEALKTAALFLRGNKAAGRAKLGQRWSDEEDRALLQDYDAGMPPDELARKLSRTMSAVSARLMKLGRFSGD